MSSAVFGDSLLRPTHLRLLVLGALALLLLPLHLLLLVIVVAPAEELGHDDVLWAGGSRVGGTRRQGSHTRAILHRP